MNLVTTSDLAEVAADVNRQTTALSHKIEAEVHRLDDRLQKVEASVHKVEVGLHQMEARITETVETRLRETQDKLDARLRETQDKFDTSLRETQSKLDTSLREMATKIDKAVERMHKTEADVHQTVSAIRTDSQQSVIEVQKAINTQTWRYVVFTGTLLTVQAGILLGLIRILFLAS